MIGVRPDSIKMSSEETGQTPFSIFQVNVLIPAKFATIELGDNESEKAP